MTIASQIINNGGTPIGLTITGNTQGTTGSGSTVIISNPANNYTGATAINAACTLSVTAPNVIPSASAVVLSERATLAMGANNQSIGSLASVSYGTVITGTGTLTVGNDNTNTTFNGAITGGGLKLVKVGTGTLTLGDVINSANFGPYNYLNAGLYGSGNTYTGGTAINGGTLSIQLDTALGNTGSGLVINGTVAASAALQSRRHVQLRPDR